MFHWPLGWYCSYCAARLVTGTSESRQNKTSRMRWRPRLYVVKLSAWISEPAEREAPASPNKFKSAFPIPTFLLQLLLTSREAFILASLIPAELGKCVQFHHQFKVNRQNLAGQNLTGSWYDAADFDWYLIHCCINWRWDGLSETWFRLDLLYNYIVNVVSDNL